MRPSVYLLMTDLSMYNRSNNYNTFISVHQDPLKSWSQRVRTAGDERQVITDVILSCVSHVSQDVLRDMLSEPSGFNSVLCFACCSDTVLCVGEQSSPRVIISPVSSRAGDSHWLPFSFFFFFFFSFTLFIYLPFLVTHNLAASISPSVPLTILISLNCLSFTLIGFSLIQFSWTRGLAQVAHYTAKITAGET